MATKHELQNQLKDQYGINKNISQPLSAEECGELLRLMQSQAIATKLVKSFTTKNEELSKNNRTFGQQRSQAEKRLKSLQAEHQKLAQEIENLEKANISSRDRKENLSKEQQELEAQIQSLSSENQRLSSKVQTLTTQNDQLIDANEVLKKDNKDLKNIVDQVRLRLARDTKMLLEYEDSEIRKALIRLFQWTLG
ncbi:hypothetical protein [Almyronema epifaneia]|uniref:Chromosome partition protein Smc n=1 Tax=Almyronema epifaneia S1 TaxID=2991925 RepID=A0ABW6IIL7_9CYAN